MTHSSRIIIDSTRKSDREEKHMIKMLSTISGKDRR